MIENRTLTLDGNLIDASDLETHTLNLDSFYRPKTQVTEDCTFLGFRLGRYAQANNKKELDDFIRNMIIPGLPREIINIERKLPLFRGIFQEIMI